MDDPAGKSRTCPNCGRAAPAEGRYCPSCGTRLTPPSAADRDLFEDALDDVLDVEPDAEPRAARAGDPIVEAEPSEARDLTETLADLASAPESATEWTARADKWRAAPGTWSAPVGTVEPAPEKRPNKALWMFLAVLGVVTFCCCSFTFFSIVFYG